MLPSLFIAHGAPLLAIENNEYTQFVNQLGQDLPKPKAVILFSAHWEAANQKVSLVDEFETIYDFGGFPEALYRIQYPAKGNKEITEEIKGLFSKQGIPFEVDTNRGLDHGAWVVLRMLYPNADIPVISMSVNQHLTPEQQYQIGKSLSVLREQDILIIGSGGTVHNLRAVNWDKDGKGNDQWAVDFDQWLEEHLNNWDTASLFDYYSLAPNARISCATIWKRALYSTFLCDGSSR